MLTLILRLGGWISRNLLVIVVAIALSTIALHVAAELTDLRRATSTLEAAPDQLLGSVQKLRRSASDALKQLEGAGSATIDREITKVTKDIAERQRSISAIGITVTPGEFIQKAKLEIEIDARLQERNYLERLRDIAFEKEKLDRLRLLCSRSNSEIQSDLRDLKQIERLMAGWSLSQRARSHLDSSSKEFQIAQGHAALDEKIQDRSSATVKACETFKTLSAERAKRAPIGALVFNDARVNSALTDIERQRAKLQSQLDGHWLEKARRAVVDEAQGPFAKRAAKMVLVGVLVGAAAWALIRALFYFVLAPAASRADPIRLLPKANGNALLLRRPPSVDVMVGEVPSASLSVDLMPGQLVAVKPECFHGASAGCIVSTRGVANRKCLRASLAAGLYNLTEVYAHGPATVTVSAGQDPLQQLALLDIPAQSAIAIRPEHILGVVHGRDVPVTITRHLRLASLQAWLTLQFRYLVLHGPLQVILTGCRGIKSEVVESERTIDREYTIGYSANLAYGVVETETFAAYVTRKKNLLRDRFRGGPGILIYEESPSASKRRRSGKRGLEDLADSAINVAGSVTGGR